MIINPKQTIDYLRSMNDTYKYLKAVQYPFTKIAKHLGVSRQTVERRFVNESWIAADFMKLIELINSKK